jgi:transposase
VHSASARYDVIRARQAGLDAERIEAVTGVPPRSQRRIAHEEIPFAMTDTQLRDQRQVGRPSALSLALRQELDILLGEEPAIKGAEALRRLRSECGYQGSKNPVYSYLAQTRPPKKRLPIVRFEGVAGEFAQHDFGTLTVAYTDGSREKLTFYAGRLKYSRAMHVCLVPADSAEGLIRGLEGFAAVMGGLPLFNVVDNTKSAVIGRRQDPATGKVRFHYQEQFASFLREVGVFAEPTAPYSGNQKGAVESLVKFVKQAFLLARRFRHREDLLTQLGEWLHWVNEERPCDATGVIPAVRLAVERERLRPLPFGERGYGLAFPAVVRPDAKVFCQGYAYSTAERWIGQAIVVRLHPEVAVLHYHQEQVVHPRIPSNGRYSLLPEHRAALFVKPRGAVMAKRQILMDLCPEGERFFTELVHRRPHTWRERDLPAAWELFEHQGEARMVEALRYCLAQGAIGGEYLRAWAMGVAP